MEREKLRSLVKETLQETLKDDSHKKELNKKNIRNIVREEISKVLSESHEPDDWGDKRNDRFIEEQLDFIFDNAFQGFTDRDRQVVYRDKTVVVPSSAPTIIRQVVTRLTTQPASTRDSFVGIMSYQGRPALLFNRTK